MSGECTDENDWRPPKAQKPCKGRKVIRVNDVCRDKALRSSAMAMILVILGFIRERYKNKVIRNFVSDTCKWSEIGWEKHYLNLERLHWGKI